MRYYVEIAFYTDGDFGFDTDSKWCRNYELDDANIHIDKEGDDFDYRLKTIVSGENEWQCKHNVRSFLNKVLCNVRFGSGHTFVMRDMYDMFNEAIDYIDSGLFFKDLGGNYCGTYIFFQEEEQWEEDYSATIHRSVCECCGQSLPSVASKYSWLYY